MFITNNSQIHTKTSNEFPGSAQLVAATRHVSKLPTTADRHLGKIQILDGDTSLKHLPSLLPIKSRKKWLPNVVET